MQKPTVRFYAGIYLVTTATLCLEISLTRYFSITQEYHFAFFIVSIAFLGYGASGSFLTILDRLGQFDRNTILANSSLLFALSVLLSYLCINSMPFDFFKLSWDVHQLFYLFLYYILLGIPFFFAGLTISFAIAKNPNFINTIYCADLLGAGTGTLLAVFIFLPRGDRGVMLLISLSALLAAMLFGQKSKAIFKGICVSVALAWTFLFITAPGWLSFRISPFKGLPLALQYSNAKILLTKWNSISRLDVLDSPAVRFAPGLSLTYSKDLPDQMGLSVDGGELTAVTRFWSGLDPSLEFTAHLPSSLPYRWVKKPRVLLVEPKGGVDVLTAVVNGASRITVIENNPLITNVLRQDLGPYTGNLYNSALFHVRSSNSRIAIRQDKELYDVIILALTDIMGSSGTGLHGFGEKYLFTVESFMEIFQKLSSKGIAGMTLYLLPPPRQELRVLSTWIAALERMRVNPKNHLCAMRTWGTISYFIKKLPLTQGDIKILKDFSEQNLFDLVYYPGIKPEEANIHNKFTTPLYYDCSQKLLSISDRTDFSNNYLFHISPVTDNRPFFNNSFKMTKIKETYDSLGQKFLPFLQGEFIVLIILIQSFILASAFIFLPQISLRKKGTERKALLPRVFLFFGLIGMGFMFVEITLIQKFVLFLGHPLFSLSIIIFSLLFSSGMGSLLSKHILRKNATVRLKGVLLICSTFLVLSPFFLPLLHKHGMSLPFGWRLVLTFLCVFPLGFFMGFPFPAGISMLKKRESRLIPWAWATNAFSSVINSVFALTIAFWGGYTLVLVLAGICYLLVLPMIHLESTAKT